MIPLREEILRRKHLLYVNHPDLSVDNVLYRLAATPDWPWLQYRAAVKKLGILQFGEPLKLGFKSTIQKIDILVLGSVARASRHGWGMLSDSGALENPLVVTLVADEQVLEPEFLPLDLLEPHDLPVDIIVTPTRIIRVAEKVPKPSFGVSSDLVTPEILHNFPCLKKFT
ncbi:Uncharacterized protein FKW44_022415 [Caligus rogercresseyi]|uniref:Uncharacterized protein n=1 Tax=Caligus rogercresseyi TaxID=217165 RepID=A0A7T8GSQ0_CALRO|nr:Uncharacterized protein FKW44_022415 [Caligus rogercresseyi]